MRKRKTVDPVKKHGTTEVTRQFLAEEDRERFEEMEARKEKDIETLRKESDGKPKI